jgi:succinate dehydrogenase (ubiquinone) cytochrome b560 subunit
MHHGVALIFLAKFTLAFPVMFHLWNGFRHLTWDLGYGFQIADLYKSGYLVIGLALATAVVLAAM